MPSEPQTGSSELPCGHILGHAESLAPDAPAVITIIDFINDVQ